MTWNLSACKGLKYLDGLSDPECILKAKDLRDYR